MVSSHITILSILIWLIWKILTHSRLARISWSFKFMPATLEPHEVDASVKSVLIVASFIHDISTRGCLHSLLLYVHCAFVLLKWSRSPQCLRFLLAGSSTLPSASMDDGEDCYTWFISFPLCLLIFPYWIISNHALCIASLLFQLLVVFSCIPHDLFDFCRWFQKVCCWVDIVILNLPNTSDMHLSELALCVLSYHWLYLIEWASRAREHFGNRIVHCLILLQIKKGSGGVMLWVDRLASFCQYFQWTNWAFSCCCQCFNMSLHKHFYLHDSQGIILEYSNLEC